MRFELRLLLIAASMLGVPEAVLGENAPHPQNGNLIDLGNNSIKRSEADFMNFSTVKKPTSPIQILENAKIAFDNDYLLDKDFYSNDNLSNFFGIESLSNQIVMMSPLSISVRSDEFGKIFGSKKYGDINIPDAEFSAGLNLDKQNNEQSFVYFLIRSGGPAYDEVERIFGDGWKLETSPRLHGPPPAKTALHGNDVFTKSLKIGSVVRDLRIEFGPDGTISSARFIEKRI